ncbi:MAG TPA: hypothetical protein VHG09_11105 [Longimicrobiales bacterium]|nr:hypothetical protein [Longimicrobiales bacterium]
MALAAVTMLAGGCAYGNTTMDDTATIADDRTVIQVANNNWSDMTIYLMRNGQRQRLGTVTSQSSEVFVVPTAIISTAADIRLVADPIGSSRTFTSPAIVLTPGQKAEWQLENSLALSSMWIR